MSFYADMMRQGYKMAEIDAIDLRRYFEVLAYAKKQEKAEEQAAEKAEDEEQQRRAADALIAFLG